MPVAEMSRVALIMRQAGTWMLVQAVYRRTEEDDCDENSEDGRLQRPETGKESCRQIIIWRRLALEVAGLGIERNGL